MKKEMMFKEIGKISTKEKNSDKTEIDKMYTMVTNKLSKEKGKKRKKVIAKIEAFGATAAVLCVCLYSFTDKTVDVEKKSKIVYEQTTNENYVVIQPNERIAVCLYAANTKGQYVDASYEQTMKKTEIREGETVNLGIYNPALSSVPGYPITISDKDDSGNVTNAKIHIEINKGELLTWNQSTGVVKTIGKSGEFSLGDSIYWSALENDKACDSATVIVQYLENDKMYESTKIEIVEMEDGTYVAERIR